MHLICPPKFCITFFFHFSRVLQPPQEKLKTMLMQNFRGQIRCMGDVQVAHKGERETRVTGDEAQRNHGKEKEERWSGSRPFSPSRLPFPVNFYRERERDVYVRGTEFTLPNFSELWTKLAKFLVTLRHYLSDSRCIVLALCDKFQRNI